MLGTLRVIETDEGPPATGRVRLVTGEGVGPWRLRAAALRLGGLLGWSAADVADFCAILTGRPWALAGRAELAEVLQELWDLGLFAMEKRRKRARGQEGGHAPRA